MKFRSWTSPTFLPARNEFLSSVGVNANRGPLSSDWRSDVCIVMFFVCRSLQDPRFAVAPDRLVTVQELCFSLVYIYCSWRHAAKGNVIICVVCRYVCTLHVVCLGWLSHWSEVRRTCNVHGRNITARTFRFKPWAEFSITYMGWEQALWIWILLDKSQKSKLWRRLDSFGS